MLKGCWNWLIAGMLLLLVGALNGCGTVADTAVQAATTSDTLVVQADTVRSVPVLVTATGTLQAVATIGDAVNVKLVALNGKAPYTWSLATGTLPPGLLLTTDGTVTGTVKTVGTYSFSIQARDSSKPVQTKTQPVVFQVRAPSLVIGTSTLSGGQAGTAYSAELKVSGGTPGYSWTMFSGTLPAGLSLTSAGAITGTPAAAGTKTFTVAVSDAGSPAQQQTRTLSLNIAPTPLAIGTTALSGGQKGIAYSAALQVSGGTPGYGWSMASGSLPAGLSLDGNGTISGTPTGSGMSTFTVAVTDSSAPAQTKKQALSLQVAPSSLSIMTAALNSAQSGAAYAATLAAAGGTPNYTWSLSAGTLPAGLALNSNGSIAGTPTAFGTSTFTVAVSDSSAPSQRSTRTLSLLVAASALNLTTTALSSGQSGSPYQAALSATGGTPSYTWSVGSGSLPAGLTLSGSGAIGGTPTSSGTSTFTVVVADAGSPAQQQSRTFSINIAPSTLAVSTTSLPAGQAGNGYSTALQATGGTPFYTWSLSSGSLPTGMTLNGNGTISGTPTAFGTSTFTVAVTDLGSPAQTKTQSLSLTVNAGALSITSSGLSNAQSGTAYSAALQAVGGTPSYTWSVSSGALPAGLALTPTGAISGTPTSSGTSTFTVVVRDNASPAQQASQTLSLTVNAAASGPLTILSSVLGNAQSGWNYSAALQATGGKPGYVWSLSFGSLPAGLTLSSSGVVSGTPTTTGPSVFIVEVHDAGSPMQQTTKILSMVVALGTPSALSVSTEALNDATSNTAYTTSLAASGGTPGYTWSLSSGTLPAGLTLSSTGVLSGTPTASGTSSFTVAVTDAASPTQQAIKPLSLTVNANQLAITTIKLAGGQSQTAYAGLLTATGGTPGYTWSVVSGTLPAGLSLGATTGAILGTPSTAGDTTFIYKVTDNGNPQQTATATGTISINAANASLSGGPTTWFIRTDGGTRYSVNNPLGQCDGKADTAYPGAGANQHCAFNDVRWMLWDNTYGKWQWAMQGGDTLVIRGCSATATQQNPDDPHCRIGWDKATGNDNGNPWCWGVTGCNLSSPPSGTAAQHTRILGGCAYDGNCNPVKDYPYTNNNLTQLFSGFNTTVLLQLNGSKYIDVQGLELTTHNGQCARYGTTHPLPGCRRGSDYPLSDQADIGIATSAGSSNILLQDVYIHGFSSSGISGPIGGPVSLTRVSIDFNTFAGWNFDDGVPTPNAAGSSITQNYVTMIGNGCQEEYPITHTQFPARGCWDSSTGGFGDAWSGQESALDSFTCDHCNISYNTKDAAMGPHTQIGTISLTNSIWQGNMGQAGKWGQRTNATFLFQNNILIGNCMRMSQQLPGAAQNFDSNTNAVGSGLSGYCRAAGALFAYFAGANSSVDFKNNTVISYQPTIFQMSCFSQNTCGTSPYRFTNNLVMGYTSAYNISPFNPGKAPGLYYQDDGTISIVGLHNLEWGIRNGDSCGTNGTVCSDPLLVNELAFFGSTESVLDNLNYHLTSGSPAISAGVNGVTALLTDYFGTSQTSTVTIGAVAP